MKGLLRFWLDELARSLPECKRVGQIADTYYYALLDAGYTVAECSCNPHADKAVEIIETALNSHGGSGFVFKRRYPR